MSKLGLEVNSSDHQCTDSMRYLEKSFIFPVICLCLDFFTIFVVFLTVLVSYIIVLKKLFMFKRKDSKPIMTKGFFMIDFYKYSYHKHE